MKRIGELISSAQTYVVLVGAILSAIQQYFLRIIPLKPTLALEGVALSSVISVAVGFYLLAQRTGTDVMEAMRTRARKYGFSALVSISLYVLLTKVIRTTGQGGWIETVFEQLVVANFALVWTLVTATAAYILLAWQARKPRLFCPNGHEFSVEEWLFCPFDREPLRRE